MSELVTPRENKMRIRRGLLVSVSVLALFGAIGRARATDEGHPTIWIELGGQFAQEQADQAPYVPSFLVASPFVTPVSGLERNSRISWDGTAKLAFETDNGWIFSAAVRYGKNSRNKTLNHQTTHGSGVYNGYHVGAYDAYQLLRAKASGSHTVLDFQAGKDVGLGSIGRSTLSAGVRFAQFNSRTNVEIQSQPTNINYSGFYHIFRAKFDSARSFDGVGPSVSWNASANLLGAPSSNSIGLDWGINAALLFGHQRVNEEHQTADNYKH
jgi:iron complex outermembrane receptor protein